jgi:hypothetical protein
MSSWWIKYKVQIYVRYCTGIVTFVSIYIYIFINWNVEIQFLDSKRYFPPPIKSSEQNEQWKCVDDIKINFMSTCLHGE